MATPQAHSKLVGKTKENTTMNEIQKATPPEAQQPTVGNIMSSNSAVAVAQTRELAESIAAVQMAKAFPRDMIQVREDVKMECMREALAKCAVYTYSRKGATTAITGPSIRLAEVLQRCLTNMDSGWRELRNEAEFVECEAFAWDKQRNIRHVVQFTVSKWRHTRERKYLLEDPRDIYEKCASEAARRKRACMLAIIPGDIVDEALEQCTATLNAKADTSAKGVQKLLDAFASFGVTKSDIEKRIQRKIEAISAPQVVDLRNVYNAMKDGMGVREDYFKGETIDVTAQEETTGKSSLKAALQGATSQAE